MNKRNLLLFLLALSAFSISRIYLFKSDKTPDLTLLNAEALAESESGGNKTGPGHIYLCCYRAYEGDMPCEVRCLECLNFPEYGECEEVVCIHDKD